MTGSGVEMVVLAIKVKSSVWQKLRLNLICLSFFFISTIHLSHGKTIFHYGFGFNKWKGIVQRTIQRITHEVFGFSSVITAVLALVCSSTTVHTSINKAVSAQDTKTDIL